jgi:pSer/pThr/pTyr-binding forkhead associated (FHA) protein
MVVVEAGPTRTFTVQPGQRLVLGRGAGADIALADPRVSPNHALIERRGPGWLVSSLDAANPAWLLDPTGRAQPIGTEPGLRSGELVIGSCQVMLYPPA